MAKLFDVDRTRIVRHISNIYKDKELDSFSSGVYEVLTARKAKLLFFFAVFLKNANAWELGKAFIILIVIMAKCLSLEGKED